MTRYALLTRTGEPMVWDFGSAARHHQMYATWLKPENSGAGMHGFRGAVAPEVGLAARATAEIKDIWPGRAWVGAGSESTSSNRPCCSRFRRRG